MMREEGLDKFRNEDRWKTELRVQGDERLARNKESGMKERDKYEG
jgi:hypothetical protein